MAFLHSGPKDLYSLRRGRLSEYDMFRLIDEAEAARDKRLHHKARAIGAAVHDFVLAWRGRTT